MHQVSSHKKENYLFWNFKKSKKRTKLLVSMKFKVYLKIKNKNTKNIHKIK